MSVGPSKNGFCILFANYPTSKSRSFNFAMILLRKHLDQAFRTRSLVEDERAR
jgi:hypothetical protein